MEATENNLGREMTAMNDRVRELHGQFKSSTLSSRDFLREQLRHYDEIKAKTILNPVKPDRLSMAAFQIEQRALERKLYPNLLIRLLVRAFKSLTLPVKVEQVKTQVANNDLGIRSAMIKAGVGEHFEQVQQKMKQGHREFSLPVSHYVSEKERMDLLLNFKKDVHGEYHFQDYKATLSTGTSANQKQQVFNAGQTPEFTTFQAYQLLAGRAVNSQQNGSEWKQLDFNDKDASGNYRMKHFPENFGFNLTEALLLLPVKENALGTKGLPLQSRLNNGERVPVVLVINGKEGNYALEANPQKREITVYDSEGKKVNLEQLKQGQTQGINLAKVQKLEPKHVIEKPQSKGKAVKV